MLEEVLNHLCNRFEADAAIGTFEVSGGSLVFDGLQDGQYYWLEGSVFNDGLHCQGDADLTDETFAGSVWLLAIPKAVIDLAEEIADWCEKNAETLDSPYQSESFDGYSYSKATGGSNSGDAVVTWQSHFRSRLDTWRKIA